MPAPFDPPRKLVGDGPYRYMRNPMYAGAVGAIAGAGLIVGSPSIIGLAVFFGLLAHGFVIVYEEPALEHKFGAGYRHYLSTVNRWLPGKPEISE